jgi:magnesium chelatase family protein
MGQQAKYYLYKDLSGEGDGACSEEILERVVRARNIQEKRYKRSRIHTNAGMTTRQIRKYCTVDADSSALLEKAMDKFGLSARAHARILKISRTIADLEGSPEIKTAHVAEAIQYRTLDRKMLR